MTIDHPAGADVEPDIAHAVDALSLHQALIDVEIANGRVVDLTHRLVEAVAQVRDLRSEISDLRVRLDALEADHRALLLVHGLTLQRRSVRLADALGALSRLFRR